MMLISTCMLRHSCRENCTTYLSVCMKNSMEIFCGKSLDALLSHSVANISNAPEEIAEIMRKSICVDIKDTRQTLYLKGQLKKYTANFYCLETTNGVASGGGKVDGTFQAYVSSFLEKYMLKILKQLNSDDKAQWKVGFCNAGIFFYKNTPITAKVLKAPDVTNLMVAYSKDKGLQYYNIQEVFPKITKKFPKSLLVSGVLLLVFIGVTQYPTDESGQSIKEEEVVIQEPQSSF